jgi:hypothetical protein
MAVYSEIRDDKNNEKNKIIEKKINGLFTINTVTNFYECLETFLRGIYNISFTKEKLDKTKMAVYSEIISKNFYS